MAGDAQFQTRALAKALAETLIPTNQTTADGQAGAIPMARGQDPGAPSADNDPNFVASLRAVESVLVEVEAFDSLRESGEADCEGLTTSYLRIEAAAEALETADLETIQPTLDAVRTDFAATGCSSP